MKDRRYVIDGKHHSVARVACPPPANSKFLVLRFGVLFKVELSRGIDSVVGRKIWVVKTGVLFCGIY